MMIIIGASYIILYIYIYTILQLEYHFCSQHWWSPTTLSNHLANHAAHDSLLSASMHVAQSQTSWKLPKMRVRATADISRLCDMHKSTGATIVNLMDMMHQPMICIVFIMSTWNNNRLVVLSRVQSSWVFTSGSM